MIVAKQLRPDHLLSALSAARKNRYDQKFRILKR